MFTGSAYHGIVVVQCGDRVGNVYWFRLPWYRSRAEWR